MNIFSNIGITELVLVLLLALIVVGPEKLPEIGRKIGQTLRDLRKAYENLASDLGPELMSIQKTTQELREAVEDIQSIPQDMAKKVVQAAELEDTLSELAEIKDSVGQVGTTLAGTGKMLKDPVGSAVGSAKDMLLGKADADSGESESASDSESESESDGESEGASEGVSENEDDAAVEATETKEPEALDATAMAASASKDVAEDAVEDLEAAVASVVLSEQDEPVAETAPLGDDASPLADETGGAQIAEATEVIAPPEIGAVFGNIGPSDPGLEEADIIPEDAGSGDSEMGEAGSQGIEPGSPDIGQPEAGSQSGPGSSENIEPGRLQDSPETGDPEDLAHD
jgi:Tat protein translocase TatB subunit